MKILCGFYNTLKKVRHIPVKARTPRMPFSFHSLALILERGRPVAKRILVGSMPLTPPVLEAERCGYQVSMLDRVMRTRDTTRPKIRATASGQGLRYLQGAVVAAAAAAAVAPPEEQQQQQQQQQLQDMALPPGTAPLPPPPQRLVEQGVDEILHLKMLESLVDAAAPATMVLASGDAAEAEFSPGFFRMVERALQKGWSIELVSFANTMSQAYRKRSFMGRWKKQFRIIMLDRFVELLWDV
jgi:hypothetical protein